MSNCSHFQLVSECCSEGRVWCSRSAQDELHCIPCCPVAEADLLSSADLSNLMYQKGLEGTVGTVLMTQMLSFGPEA